MDQQFQQTPQEPQIKESFINKKIIIAVVVIVALLLIGLGIWIWQITRVSYMPDVYIPKPTEPHKPASQDTTSAINNDLNSINVESVDDNFKDIDADLNSL